MRRHIAERAGAAHLVNFDRIVLLMDDRVMCDGAYDEVADTAQYLRWAGKN